MRIARSLGSSILVIAACTLSYAVHADGGCPPGEVPQQGNGWKTCIPTTSDGGLAQAPAPIWAPRWQAIATDLEKGLLGTAVDRPTGEAAERDAMLDCTIKGGTSCKIVISTGNGCVALVVGKSLIATGEGLTKADASRQALRECEKSGVTCKRFYEECSLPVRVR